MQLRNFRDGLKEGPIFYRDFEINEKLFFRKKILLGEHFLLWIAFLQYKETVGSINGKKFTEK